MKTTEATQSIQFLYDNGQFREAFNLAMEALKSSNDDKERMTLWCLLANSYLNRLDPPEDEDLDGAYADIFKTAFSAALCVEDVWEIRDSLWTAFNIWVTNGYKEALDFICDNPVPDNLSSYSELKTNYSGLKLRLVLGYDRSHPFERSFMATNNLSQDEYDEQYKHRGSNEVTDEDLRLLEIDTAKKIFSKIKSRVLKESKGNLDDVIDLVNYAVKALVTASNLSTLYIDDCSADIQRKGHNLRVEICKYLLETYVFPEGQKMSLYQNKRQILLDWIQESYDVLAELDPEFIPPELPSGDTIYYNPPSQEKPNHPQQKRVEDEKQKRIESERKAAELQAQKEAEAKSRKKFIAIFLPLLVIAIAAAVIVSQIVIPNNKYNDAVALMEAGKFEDAIYAFEALNGYKDSADKIIEAEDKILEAKYAAADQLFEAGQHSAAAIAFGSCGNYNDAPERAKNLWNDIAVRDTIDAEFWHVAGLKTDGTVVAIDGHEDDPFDISGWRNIIAITGDDPVYSIVGLKPDGTVVCAKNGENLSDWHDIVAIDSGFDFVAGLKSDGTVVSDDSSLDTSAWHDIVAISAGRSSVVALKLDGTVVATGRNDMGQCDTSNWRDIVAVSAGFDYTLGLKSDGTVVATGTNEYGQCNVSDWQDIIAISAGTDSLGLKADGTVVTTDVEYDLSGWNDIVAVSAGSGRLIGLKADGTVVSVGDDYVEFDISDWCDIRIPTK